MTQEGRKHDKGKPRYSLIPVSPLRDVAEVFTFGAEKYGVKNYLYIDDENRIVDALMRHTEALRSGEYLDPESGKPHTAHIATNAMILQEMRETKKQGTKLKELVKKFSFRGLSEECVKQDWRLPTLEEVKRLGINKHQFCWVSDLPEKKEDRETHALMYDRFSDKTYLVNKSNLTTCAVVKL